MKRWCNWNWNRIFYVYYMCVSIEEIWGRVIEYDILVLLFICDGKRVLVNYICIRFFEVFFFLFLIFYVVCLNWLYRKNLICWVLKGRF